MGLPSIPPDLASVDFALGVHCAAWLRHAVLGDPSFDTFVRHPANPIHTGSPPLEWPVNGFLFRDPPTGHWYLYIGHYSAGYRVGPGKGMLCTVYESTDDGRTWSHRGPVFPDEPFYFTGLKHPLGYAPDVSVVYEAGRYHMAYDWSTTDATGLHDGDSGIGYAWSESPRGPFLRHPEPLVLNARIKPKPFFGKHNRLYATTLLRRAQDWLLLAIMDSRKYFSWGLVGMSAQAPEGPYADPVPLFHTEDDRYQMPLMEYFPSFAHAGYVYAPATSVALNRDFQTVHRALLEDALHPEAWELLQHGSVWHAERVPNEACGIWGQAYSGVVDAAGEFRVLFPSKTAEDLGTINLASRTWAQPMRERGFAFSGNQGSALTCLRRVYGAFTLRAALGVSGTAQIRFGMLGPLGANAAKSDATLHALCATGFSAVECSASGWRVLHAPIANEAQVLAAGNWGAPGPLEIELRHDASGESSFACQGKECWRGTLPHHPGPLGLWVAPASSVKAERFEVHGKVMPAAMPFLYTEALLGAGQNMKDWREASAPHFRFGIGAVQHGASARAKWNFIGTGFGLWMPRGPAYGSVRVRLDGATLPALELHAAADERSAPVLVRDGLADGPHALVLESDGALLPQDSLDVHWTF